MDLDSNKTSLEKEAIVPVGEERLNTIFNMIFSHHGCAPLHIINNLLTISSNKTSRRSHRIKIKVSFANSTLSVYDVTSLTDTPEHLNTTTNDILSVLSFFDLDSKLPYSGWSDIEARHRFLEKYIGNVATPIND